MSGPTFVPTGGWALEDTQRAVLKERASQLDVRSKGTVSQGGPILYFIAYSQSIKHFIDYSRLKKHSALFHTASAQSAAAFVEKNNACPDAAHVTRLSIELTYRI